MFLHSQKKRNRAISSNHCYLIQNQFGIIWSKININYICFRLILTIFALYLTFLARFFPLAKRQNRSQIRKRTLRKEVTPCPDYFLWPWFLLPNAHNPLLATKPQARFSTLGEVILKLLFFEQQLLRYAKQSWNQRHCQDIFARSNNLIQNKNQNNAFSIIFKKLEISVLIL